MSWRPSVLPIERRHHSCFCVFQATVADTSADFTFAAMGYDHLPKAYYRVLRFQAHLPVLLKPTIYRIGDLFYANRIPPTERYQLPKKVRRRLTSTHTIHSAIRSGF